MGRRSHLRGLHYYTVSQKPAAQWPDGTVYGNTESNWEKLCAAAVWARYMGIGNWDNLVDRKHPDPHDEADYNDYDFLPRFEPVTFSADSLKNTLLKGAPHYSTNGLSTYHLEVWVEKNSMNEAIGPAIRRFGAVLQPLVGESSLERVTGAIGRIIASGKPARIFYISDFDPSGLQMPVSVARKLEYFARSLGLDIRLNPLALTNDQVVRLKLPGIPTKASDSRAASFVANYGDRATELDALEALHPGELRRIVAAALSPYVDESKVKAVRDLNANLKGLFDAATNLVTLNDIADQLDRESERMHKAGVDLTKDAEYPLADHEADEQEVWLLDTTRTESEQLEAYAEYKQGS
jgi:hypothetical protein